MKVLYCDGEFVEKLSLDFDDAILFGHGVFTTIRIEDGNPWFLEDHMKRLSSHCKKIGLQSPTIQKRDIDKLIDRNGLQKTFSQLRLVALKKEKKTLLIMQIEPAKKKKEKELRLLSVTNSLFHPFSQIKSLHYFPRQWLYDEGQKKGYDERLFLYEKRWVVNSCFSNIFWIKNDVLCYPEYSLPYMEGITLSYLKRIWKRENESVVPLKCEIKDLQSSFVFLCNSLRGVVSVKSIDGIDVPMSEALRKWFNEALRQEAASLEKGIFFIKKF